MAEYEREFGGHLGGEGLPTGEHQPLTAEEARARKGRNLAIALGVVIFIGLVFATTVLRMSAAIEAGRTPGEAVVGAGTPIEGE